MIKIRKTEFDRRLGITSVVFLECLFVVFIIVNAMNPSVTVANEHVYGIASARNEPSFGGIWYDYNNVMGGMWAIINGTRTIDIKNFEPNENNTYSRIVANYSVLQMWTFFNGYYRMAVWTVCEDHVNIRVEWYFPNATYVDELVEPYWEFAGGFYYNESAIIKFYDDSIANSYDYSIVPRTFNVVDLTRVELNYVPRLRPNPNSGLILRVDYAPCMSNGERILPDGLGIARTHGTDFFPIYTNRVWHGRYWFSYNISIIDIEEG